MTGADDLYRVAVRFEKAAAGAQAHVRTALTRISIGLVAYIRTNKLQGNPIHQRSGRLSRGITSRVVDRLESVAALVGVFGGVPYARGLEEGNRAHRIVATNAKALRFSVGGAVLFRKAVQHPGNRAFRYLSGSLQENKARIVMELNTAAFEALTK